MSGPFASDAALAQVAATTPWHLERIHATGAHLAGLLGAGVPVALVDTGLRASHADLQGSVLTGYSVVNASWVTHDWLGHGTHVAGIVASRASGPTGPGVAPGAQLVPVQIFSTGTTTDAVLAAGIRYAGTRATIINLSLTAGGPVAVSAMQEAIARGGLIVAAAGNGAAAHPDWPARFARESWANGPGRDGALIAVGAVDRDNRLAAFSNRAGDAAPWFLVAPGVDIVSSDAYDETGHVAMSGTSMAAPMVSGTAALLKGHWPRLRAGQIAGILLATATDLGAPGVDAVYGRGLLDVEAAMRPVGPLRTMTAAGLQPLSGATLRLSAATSALAAAAGQGGLRVVGVDDFERDYATDAGAGVSSPSGMRLDAAFAGLDRRFNAASRTAKGTDRLSLEIDPPIGWSGSPYAATGGRATMPAVSVIARDGAGITGFGTGGTASRFFGLGGLTIDGFGTQVPLADVAALANPYLSLVPQATHVARGVQRVDTTFKAGVVAGVNAWEPGAGWGRVSAGAVVLEAAHAMPLGGTVALGYAVAQESGAYLGGVGVGPLSLGNRVRTDSLQASAAWPVAPATVLAGSVSVGYTPAVRAGPG